MDLSRIYPKRTDWVHKGNFGRLLVVAGSKLYSGAPSLVGVSALRAGCDLVTVCAPHRAADVAARILPDLMTFPLRGDRLYWRHVGGILEVANERKINAMVIGNGLGRETKTFSAMHKLISKLSVPMVLDSDALRAIVHRSDVTLGKQVILTPHGGELAILVGAQKEETDFDGRLLAAKQAALRYHAVVLVKGHVDIITDGATTITNNSGSVYMTKGGFGDTLAGICGALLSRGIGLFEAAQAAAYINGRAGEMAAEKYGEGVAASDIFKMIPKVITD